MRRPLIALALATALSAPALAQNVAAGSGIVPSTVANSAGRPIGFSATVPTGGVLVIPMRDATIPSNTVDSATAQAIQVAIAAAKYEGKQGSMLSLRGIGGYARILLSGTGDEGNRVANVRDAAGKAAQELKDESQPVALAGSLTQNEAAAAALGFALGQYRFDRTRRSTKRRPHRNLSPR